MPGGPGHCLLTVKCLGPGTHRKTNTWGLPGGGGEEGGGAMLTVGIDLHVISQSKRQH